MGATLGHVDVVLVRPRSPGNVGAAARAIANHGLGRLILVAPPAFDPEQARWMAPGAHAVIDHAILARSVEEAVSPHQRVVGTSGRSRRWRWPVRSPWELGASVVASPAPTALLFGPEDFGLSNADLSVCTELLTLPTAGHDSLNLAQAVTVTASWMLGAWCQQRDRDAGGSAIDGAATAPTAPPTADAAPVGLRDAVIQDLMEVLDASGYLRSRSELQVRSTLHQLLGRLQPTRSEAGMLRGMLKPTRWQMGLLAPRDTTET